MPVAGSSLWMMGCSLFVLLLVALCALGAIPPNRAVGMRTRLVMRSRAAWRPAHRAALLPVALATVLISAMCGAGAIGLIREDAVAAISPVALIAGLMWAAMRADSCVKRRVLHSRSADKGRP